MKRIANTTWNIMEAIPYILYHSSTAVLQRALSREDFQKISFSHFTLFYLSITILLLFLFIIIINLLLHNLKIIFVNKK